MADIRIKDLATTATTTASDDFMAVDGAINGTRKLSAAAPAFLTSVTTPSLTSPAATNLTLAGGAGNSSIILTPAGTGNVGIGLTVPTSLLTLATNSVLAWAYDPANTVSTHTITGGGTNPIAFKVYGFSADTPIFTFTGNTGAAKVTILNGGNVLIGTTDSTGLTGAGGLKIASTTAGAANAGALVVTGGISAAGASYFGGAVEITGATTLNNDVYQTALKKFYVDSGSNTYFHENSSDSFQIVTGGTVASTLTAGSVLFNGTVIAPAATVNLGSLRIPHGTAPASPTNGDMWTTTAGLFIRINGVTKTVTLT